VARRAGVTLSSASGVPGARPAGDPSSVVASLTRREREVLQLVARGATNRQIGTALYISTKTASVHVSRILARLGAASREEPVTLVRRAGGMASG